VRVARWEPLYGRMLEVKCYHLYRNYHHHHDLFLTLVFVFFLFRFFTYFLHVVLSLPSTLFRALVTASFTPHASPAPGSALCFSLSFSLRGLLDLFDIYWMCVRAFLRLLNIMYPCFLNGMRWPGASMGIFSGDDEIVMDEAKYDFV
jgi:hypothetical protein